MYFWFRLGQLIGWSKRWIIRHFEVDKLLSDDKETRRLNNLFLIGLKKALAVEHRVPLRMVPWGIMKPVWNSPLPSRFSKPSSTPASTKAVANGVRQGDSWNKKVSPAWVSIQVSQKSKLSLMIHSCKKFEETDLLEVFLFWHGHLWTNKLGSPTTVDATTSLVPTS